MSYSCEKNQFCNFVVKVKTHYTIFFNSLSCMRSSHREWVHAKGPLVKKT